MFKRLLTQSRKLRTRRLAAPAILSALTLAAGALPAQSADYFDHGRYMDRGYEVAVPVEPQHFRGEPRAYRVIVIPETRSHRYEHGYEYGRVPLPPPHRHGGYFEGAVPYASSSRDRAYEQGYRDGLADRRDEVYGHVPLTGERLLPPAPVGSAYRPIGY